MLLIRPVCFLSLSLFFSPNNRLLTCLWADFYATKICIRCRPRLYIFHSLIVYIFLIFAGIKFKVSLLISLLYTLLQDEILPWFEKTKRKEKRRKEKKKQKKNRSYHFEFSTQNEKLVVHASAPRRTSVCDKLTKKKIH